MNTKDRQINIKVSALQFRALRILGGPTAVIEWAIEQQIGEKEKLKRMKQQILANIETEQKRILDIDMLLKNYEERAAEEQRQKLEAKKKEEGLRNKNNGNGNSRKLLSKEEWIQKWKPEFVRELQEKGELHEINYKGAFQRLGFKTKKEVKAWVRS